MKTFKLASIILCLTFCLASCKDSSIVKNLSLEGELYAKNIITVKYDAPDSADLSFQWYLEGDNADTWTVLPGIYTPNIVLLMEYTGKRLKCEITTKEGGKVSTTETISATVENRENPNIDWFADAGIGLMVHFLKARYAKEGGSKEWNTVVDGFDVERFADECKDAGVNYVLWALGQNDGYYNSPNSAYDKITEVAPGELCSNRDLPADLIKALKKQKIKFMAYLPGNPPIFNKYVSEKFQYPHGYDSPTSQFTQACWESVIREWSLRYGEDLKGWWFDGMYHGGIIETRSDMNLKHNISTHTLAAKAGNPKSIVSYNYGVDKVQSDSPYDDYSAGEENNIIQLPESRWILSGIQWFHFTHLGEFWGKPGIKNRTDDLERWSEKVFQKEGVLCFDVYVSPCGDIDPQQKKQLKAMAKVLEKVQADKK